MLKLSFPKRETLKAPTVDATCLARRVLVSDCLAFESHVQNVNSTGKPMFLSTQLVFIIILGHLFIYPFNAHFFCATGPSLKAKNTNSFCFYTLI